MTTDRCGQRCPVCHRLCRAAQPYNHRFDCCGQIHAHITGLHRDGERWWRDIDQPMQAGYLTGPSQTTRRS